MVITELQNDFNIRHVYLPQITGPGLAVAPPKPRTPGLHVSQIIQHVATTMGYLKRDDDEELDWTLAKYRMAHGADIARLYPTVFYRVVLGLAWEQWLGTQLPAINFHGIGELTRDAIVGTPDGLEFLDSGAGRIHEIKLTWKSSRSDRETPAERIGREFMWVCQTKSYAQMARAVGFPVLESHLHVFWVNGNYRGSGPEYRRYGLQFEERELDANWKLIRNSAQYVTPETGE